MACIELVSFAEERILWVGEGSLAAAIGYAVTQGLFIGKRFTTNTFCNWVDDGWCA